MLPKLPSVTQKIARPDHSVGTTATQDNFFFEAHLPEAQ
jgi:hypothetical protein